MMYTDTSGEVCLGQIMYFTLQNKQPAALLKKLEKLPPFEHFHPTTSVFPVVVTQDLEVIHCQAILHKVIFISTQLAFFVAEFPNNINFD